MDAEAKKTGAVETGSKTKSVSFDEYALWKEFKNGDVGAYALIYQQYFFILFNYGKKISQDHELIKDCIQELFIKIWNNRENLNETTSIKYYLFTALKRKLLDVLRKPQLEFITDQAEHDESAAGMIQIADDTDEDQASPRKDKVVKALNLLSQHQQKLLDMKFQKNLSNKEIADELGITIQSVYNAVFKALRSIRKQLSSLSAILFLLY
ncbi:MAG TPA: sigma-70 family RNA polymerase sigma factor [Cyclobacteriaceae bacterium]